MSVQAEVCHDAAASSCSDADSILKLEAFILAEALLLLLFLLLRPPLGGALPGRAHNVLHYSVLLYFYDYHSRYRKRIELH